MVECLWTDPLELFPEDFLFCCFEMLMKINYIANRVLILFLAV
nr:MAG TPA: hypothetical protein [Caudoviricetes sp.]